MKPTKKIKLGKIVASIWRNQSEFGNNYSTEILRIEKIGDDWKTFNKFNASELLIVSEISRQCAVWIMNDKSGD